MGKENSYHTYTFADIQQYLSGSMNPAEMHAIERAALQDSFLADAIEGYRNADFASVSKDLNEINALLQNENEETKIVSIHKNRNQWWRIAIAVIVLAGAGISGVYLFNEHFEKSKFAQVKLKANTSLQESLKSNSNVKDSIKETFSNSVSGMRAQEIISTPGINKSKEGNSKPEETKTIQGVMVYSAGAASIKADEHSENNNIDLVATTVSNDDNEINMPQLSSNDKQLKGKVSGGQIAGKKNERDTELTTQVAGGVNSNAGELIQSKEVNIVGSNISGAAESKDTLGVAASAKGKDAKNMDLAKTENIQFILQNNDLSMGDVVIKKIGTKNEKSSIKVDGDKKAASPIGGWDVYEGYIIEKFNSNNDTTVNASNINGEELELEFAIDNNGNPYNILILSPDKIPGLNKKVIDVISEGPRWIKRINKRKERIKIKF